MTNKTKKNTNTLSTTQKILGPKQHVNVLYQNLGGTWYAFANVNEEIFFSRVQLKQTLPSPTPQKKLTPTDVSSS